MFDTKQNVQYGWQSGGGWQSNPRNSDVVELPMAPMRRRPAGAGCEGCMNWHTFGILLSLLAAATLALGVADVVVTYKTYMDGMNCATYPTLSYCSNLVWTWVASGIWGSLPVFIFGVLSIYKGSNPMRQVNYFDLFAFICAFIFTPAIIVLSAIEVWMGRDVYYWNGQNGGLTSDDLVKAIIPIVISGLGLVMMIMTLTALFYLCCNQAGPPMPYTNQYSGYPQGTYDRPYKMQQANNQVTRSQASTFYAAQAPPRVTSTYNQYHTGPMPCGGCAPNNAYNYFRS